MGLPTKGGVDRPLRPRERSRIAPKNVTGKPTKPVGSANLRTIPRMPSRNVRKFSRARFFRGCFFVASLVMRFTASSKGARFPQIVAKIGGLPG